MNQCSTMACCQPGNLPGVGDPCLSNRNLMEMVEKRKPQPPINKISPSTVLFREDLTDPKLLSYGRSRWSRWYGI